MDNQRSIRDFINDWTDAVNSSGNVVLDLPESIRQTVRDAGGDPDTLYLAGVEYDVVEEDSNA
jgi:hypothetical protein